MIAKNDTVEILFLGKKDLNCEKAFNFLSLNFKKIKVYFGDWMDDLPKEIGLWSGHYIISYLSRWVISEDLIKRAKIAAINFHPGTQEYSRIGYNNFTFYENAREYGVTCHYMDKKVDTGKIISVKRFPVCHIDDVVSLLSKIYDVQLVLFYEIIGKIISGCDLPVSSEKWTRSPFTRKQFNDLFIINQNMNEIEV